MNLIMLLTELGVELQAEGDKLIVETSTPLSNEQRSFIRVNKQRLLGELYQKKAC